MDALVGAVPVKAQVKHASSASAARTGLVADATSGVGKRANIGYVRSGEISRYSQRKRIDHVKECPNIDRVRPGSASDAKQSEVGVQHCDHRAH